MPTTQQSPHFAKIRSWLNEIHREKQAAATSKKGEAYAEPGSYEGQTTHPVKNVDDGLQKATEGARASENESDIKKQEWAGNVNETPDNPGPSQESLNRNMGTQQSATGEDPSVEDDYRGRQSDPGTSHPASMEVGEKYSAWVKKEAKALSGLANDILADIATGHGFANPSNNAPTQPKQPEQPAEKAAQTDQTTQQPQQTQSGNAAAAQAGYELAAFLGLNKEAADQVTENVAGELIKQAQMNADRVGSFLLSFTKESESLLKKAEGDDDDTGADPTTGNKPDPNAIAAAAQADASAGGLPMGGPGGPGGGPGGPPVGGPGGPDVGGPGGPDAGGPGGPGGAGGGGHDAALQELAMALMELGISPEELASAVAQGGAGGAGPGPDAAGGAPGGPDMGGGAPPGPMGAGSPADMGAKIASAVYQYKRSGKFEVRPAKTAGERAQRNEMKRYIMEIMGASRG